jgi:hypothetical protein
MEKEMNRTLTCVALICFLAMPAVSFGSGGGSSAGRSDEKNSSGVVPAAVVPMRPFSKLAFGGGVGINGINLQAATNLNRYMNIRATGNVFSYTVNDITSNGFTASGKLDFATMGASLDFYPWPNHGFRLSPGVLAYNQNSLTANATVTGGQSFTLNDVDYYSSFTDPIRASAKLGLNSTKPAFTMTTGWGNMISRTGGHWSIPFELGAAFVGSPSFNMTVAGTACDSRGLNCVNAATDPTVQSNLSAQIDKYKKDVDVLKVFPILSVGVSYSFNIR